MSFLFGRKPSGAAVQAERLHDDLVAAIRRPAFYLQFGVPDTFEGRFDLLVLHVALVLRRLRASGKESESVAQHLVDTLFARLEIALRELGVSDIAVPKRMKRLAEAFNGRTASYFTALDAQDENALAAAVERNVLGHPGGQDLARYALRIAGMLESSDLASAGSALPALPDPVEAV